MTDQTTKTNEKPQQASGVTALASAILDEQQRRASEQVPELGRMSNAELREYVLKKHGFAPGF